VNARLALVGAAFVALFGAIGLRLVDLGLGSAAPAAAGPVVAAETPRADLLDRHGRVLATTVPAPRIVADPAHVRDPAGEAGAIAAVVDDVDAAALARRLAAGGRYVVVHREASLDEVEAVRRLGLPALWVEYRHARVYPNGRLAAHLLGHVDVDNNGLAGAERAFDDRLSGPDAAPVHLALDLAVQSVVEDELRAAKTRHRAEAAAALVMDVRTGELLAAASLPDFDPHHAGAAGGDARKDRNLTQTFELGSVFKLLNVAMGLNAGVVDVASELDATEPIVVNGHRIRDFRPEQRPLSVPEALMHSSNIANARIALRVGAERQRAFLDAFALDRPLALETGNVARPQLPARWPEVTVATVAFGHGIAVTPLHLASAVGGLLGPGHPIEPTLERRDAPLRRAPVVERRLVETMRGLAWRVATEGSGSQAQVAGYLVGGKTGTAEKLGPDGTYQDGEVRSSFVAVLPVHAPRYVVFAMLDEPVGLGDRPDLRYGGWTAAPAVGAMIARIGPILGLEPSPADALRDLERWGGLTPVMDARDDEGGADAARRSRG
jgi:cell division protein FtsI (penicillin-binding protein 3)